MPTVLDQSVMDYPGIIVLDVPVETTVVAAADVTIPAGIVDFASFGEWVHSTDFPERGRIDYVHERIEVDLSMEDAYSHNQVKSAFIVGIESVLRENRFGRFFGDKMRISLPHSRFSTEPDGMFLSFESIRSGVIRRLPGKNGGVTEFEGTSDMILEVVSDYSEEKDALERPERYANAGVGEFWRIDARGESSQFDLLILRDDGYTSAEAASGWQRSPLFGKWFQLIRTLDPLGDPLFELRAKD